MRLLLLFLFFLLSSPLLFTHSLNQEGLYLHQLTTTLIVSTTDDDLPPSSSPFTTWGLNDSVPCNWTGITCDPSSSSVTSIDLSSSDLSGPFPTILCRLNNLTFISLYNNYINDTLPSNISTCSSLQHLNLAQNVLTGQLPPSLSNLSNLKYLDLGGNNFSGDVPISYGSFHKLEFISLIENLLDGDFPMVLANISTLKQFNMSYNPFKPSELGPEIGNLSEVEVLWFTECNLVGQIPEEIGKLKKLRDLDLAKNDLNGSIPNSITGLTNIVQIELFGNSLSGEIPAQGWGDLKELRMVDLSMNGLNGSIPEELTRLPLSSLNLYENQLEGQLSGSIANSPNLYELKLFTNKLTGSLPKNLGENSPLVLVDISNNLFSGELPGTLCAKGVFEELLFMNNSLSGEIPSSLGECRSLKRIRLASNKLSGNVPDSFWGLPHVSLLELANNSFTGRISKAIASASNLSTLEISKNKFSGRIPEEIGSLNELVGFLASENQLSGSLPSSIVDLGELGRLDLHKNRLSGGIPDGIRSWKKLNDLNLANNQFSGEIPAELGSLSVLNYLDLSSNQFTGEVPEELQNLRLNQLNMSYNLLSGNLPPFFAKGIYEDSFLGNPGLCGDIPGLCDKNRSGVERGKGYMWLLRSIFILAGLVLVVGLVWFYCRYRNFKKGKGVSDRSKWTLMSFHKLGFSEYEILDCLDEDNVIGSGASGKVYRAVLSSGETVAVKKLWGRSNKVASYLAADEDVLGNLSGGDLEKGRDDGGDDGFEAEVETLGKIRHKNIVRLWCCCSTKECKLLVYEYMHNGSLGDVLHKSSKGGLLLNWPIRYKIALDAADGLSYLHHDCVPPIVHRDVKSNNILLDGEFGAKVADFGVAKVVDVTVGRETKSMSVIAGSCGYIAPEYAYTLRVNEKSDTYSFGVVMLELVTGKKPVDPEYGEKDLVKWVCTTLDQKGVDHVIDPKLESCFKEDICKVLNISLLCTSPLPINRPSMRRVVKMLQEVAGENLSTNLVNKKDGKLTPYYYCDDNSETKDSVV